MKRHLWLLILPALCLASPTAAAPAPTWDEVRLLNEKGHGDPQSGRLVYRVETSEFLSTNTRQGALPRNSVQQITQIFDDSTHTAREDFVPLTPEGEPRTAVRRYSDIGTVTGRPGQELQTARAEIRFGQRGWLEAGQIPFPTNMTGQWLRTEMLGNVEALVYELRRPGAPNIRALVWLAPSRDYQVERLELRRGPQGEFLHIEQTNSDYRAVNGTMLPHQIRRVTYAPMASTDVLPYMKKETVTLSEAELNQPIAADAFRVPEESNVASQMGSATPCP